MLRSLKVRGGKSEWETHHLRPMCVRVTKSEKHGCMDAYLQEYQLIIINIDYNCKWSTSENKLSTVSEPTIYILLIVREHLIRTNYIRSYNARCYVGVYSVMADNQVQESESISGGKNGVGTSLIIFLSTANLRWLHTLAQSRCAWINNIHNST